MSVSDRLCFKIKIFVSDIWKWMTSAEWFKEKVIIQSSDCGENIGIRWWSESTLVTGWLIGGYRGWLWRQDTRREQSVFYQVRKHQIFWLIRSILPFSSGRKHKKQASDLCKPRRSHILRLQKSKIISDQNSPYFVFSPDPLNLGCGWWSLFLW